MKKDKKLIGAGLLTAIASSLCCITPVLALISGTSGIASTFSWMEPFRPYLIGLTVLVLAFAWYQKLKPRSKEEIACDCDEEEKTPFVQTKLFLGIVTVFAIIMIAFPYYSSVFYGDNKKEIMVVDKSNIEKISVDIKGMTCTSCEEHIDHSVNELDGIININSSYENGKAEIEFDDTKTTIEEIEKAINKTGYKVIETKPIN
ncbi:MAG: mercuric transport protein MerTP [Flavobacteriales bacterium]